MGWSLEALKHKIHNTRLPIKNKKVLFLVQCCYFCAPIAIGCAIMQYVTPDPEELRARMKPSELADAMTERNRQGMQEALNAARAAHEARVAAKREAPPSDR